MILDHIGSGRVQPRRQAWGTQAMRPLLVLTAALATLYFGSVAQAQTGFWKGRNGEPVAETESMKSKDDFAGSLVVTPDADWKEKWNTPPETQPSFQKADVVPYGKKVFVLIFFSNPRLDAQGDANVQCDLQIVAPTGASALAQKNVPCYRGKIKGNLYHLYLSDPVIAFSGDPGDPAGTWEVKVLLRDAVRGTELPLRTTFGLRGT
jgi:hypothetical protein